MKFLKLELSKEDMNSARNYYLYGFDNSQQLNNIISGQQVIKFDSPDE